MTLFEEFVTTIHAHLHKRYPDSTTTRTTVQSILSPLDLADVLQPETTEVMPQRLQLRRIRMSGRKHTSPPTAYTETLPFVYDCRLGPGINGWIARNGTGKSTILKAIVWALTGGEQPFKQDIRSWIEDVALELTITNVTYTIRYFPRLELPKVTGFIVEQSIDTILQNQSLLREIASFSGTTEMAEKIALFFENRLHLAPFPAEPPEGLFPHDPQKTLSWQIYSQALFIGSDYTDYLFPKNNVSGKPHQKTLSMYLGLGSTEILTKLELARDMARDEHRFEVRRVTVNAQGVQRKIEEVQAKLRFIEGRINSIDTGQSVLVDPTYLSEVQEQLSQRTARVTALSISEQHLLKEERETQRKIAEMKRACQELRETIQFKVFLSGLTVERCPLCEQDLVAERVEDVAQKKQCRLCHSELRPIQSIEQYDLLLEETQQSIKKLEQSLKITRKELKATITMRKEEEKSRTHYYNELQDLPRQERVGFTQEIRDLINERGYLHGQLQQLQEQTIEVHTEKLNDLKEAQEILETALTEMQALIWQRYAAHWNTLEEEATELAKRFGVTDVERISFRFGEHFDLSVKQGGKFIRYRNMEASEMLRLKLAFHLALFLVSTANPLGRHPGILLVDAPGGAEMDEQHLQHILDGFATMRNKIGVDGQILIASTKEDIASICDPAHVDRVQEDDTLF